MFVLPLDILGVAGLLVAGMVAWRVWRLRSGRRQLELLAAMTPDAMMVRDQEGRIALCNEAAESMFGYSRQEILGLDSRILLPGWAPGAGEGTAPHTTIEAVAVHKDRTEVPVEIATSTVKLKGRWLTVGVVRDVSEHKQREEELRRAKEHAEEMASELAAVNTVFEQTTVWANEMAAQAAMASAAKSEFLAAMSHEIRTPMNGVLGMLTLLEQTVLTAEQLDCVETIRYSGQTLLDLINQILDLSRIESGRVDLEEVEFDPRTQVEQAVVLFAERAEAKGIELVATISDGVPRRLRGDPGRFRQILINLLGNSMKFTEKGEVSVDVQASLEGDSAELRVEVRDTGIGMSAEVTRKLFQPFYQGDGSTRRKFGGTGLGLAISKKLVEAMKGTIEVSSAVGRGSSFRFTLAGGIVPAGPEEAQPPPLSGMRALVLHRNAAVRKMLCYYTGTLGMIVLEAEDAGQALELLGAGDSYRFVIADASAPGLEQLRQRLALCAGDGGSRPALLLLVSPGKRWTPESVGADSLITKPVRGSRLREALLSLVRPPEPPAASLAGLASIVAQTDSAPERPAGRKVLIAEDNPVNQKVARRLVEKLGYTADVVENGQEAVAAVSAREYAVILMDCQMPVMDGYRAAAAIRLLKDGHGLIPIVAMTANALKGDRERCLKAGMSDYIPKPVSLPELKAALERWYDQTHPTSPAKSADEWADDSVFDRG